MRIAFTGGGTGGHVFPNLAVIEELRRQETGSPQAMKQRETEREGTEVFYIGEKGGMEEELVKKYGVPFYGIRAGKMRRYFDFKNFVDIFKIPLGFFEAVRILRRLKPHLVFAKGGYVSFPVALAAFLLRIPVWLHESDVSPGLAARICGRFAERIFLSFEESRERVEIAAGDGSRVEVVGNPIRKKILRGSAEKGYALTGFSPKKPVLLIMGGSTGAQSLNKLILKILPKLLEKYQVIHITGLFKFSTALPLYRSAPNYQSFPFLHDELAHIYAITDLAISRAGSGGIFELLALKKPMILIPLPRFASRGDQIENAAVFEKRGWAHVLDQTALAPQKLLENILELLADKKLRSRMIDAQRQAAYFQNAAKKIAAAVISSEGVPRSHRGASR